MIDNQTAKKALDSLIKKSRVHLYKPIQIAEILFRHRVYKDIDLLSKEDYRISSRKWRDNISIELLGRKCTSTARFQDNLFDDNAIPPHILQVLGEENVRTGGAVEAYIYRNFTSKYSQLSNALDKCLNADKETFNIKDFIDSFWLEPGLRRSLDKVYEIIVYALFSTIVEAVELKVEVFVKEKFLNLLKDFEDFSNKVMCIDVSNPRHVEYAKIYRVGVTNAADRGLDMYVNWGPSIQIKHLSLSVELAQDIVGSISSDKIIIVCKDAEKDVIYSLLTQVGWKSRIQSIITENDLVAWYEKALRGQYQEQLASKLLERLAEEIVEEFPSVDGMPQELVSRNYDQIKDDFWC